MNEDRFARRADVPPFMAMDVLAHACKLEEAGRSIIHMELGQPGAPAPSAARKAAAERLTKGSIGYTPARGIFPLRQRIARHYLETQGVDVDPDAIAITLGSSGGIVGALLACFDVGQKVAITAPGYPAYKTMISSLGLKPVTITLDAQSGWLPTPELVRKAHAAEPFDGLIIMSPSNPTGTVIPADVLKKLIETCAELGIRLFSDEIYHGLEYGEKAVSALKFTNQAVIINSFSKFFCMTGWRIGWLVLPPALQRPFERLQQNLFICAAEISQVAALAAFDGASEMNAVRQGYANNRKLILGALSDLGFKDTLPADGAFYIYTKLADTDPDSPEFCKIMLEETGVATTPGLDFDPARGHRYVRFSYCCSEAHAADAMSRIRQWRSKK